MVCFAVFPDCLAAIDLGRERVRCFARCRCGRFQGFLATSAVGATDDRVAIRRSVVGMDLIVLLLVVLIVLALVGSVAVSPLLLALVVILVLFAVLGRGRYFARRG